ncbi:DUF1223 domain-containing protein [Sagittula salina]|uniref:DUF1223 domain-containing protein n=1 Tax=Sagittula salina TaxID=2820268 RepID=A0A940MHU2_9RHOB|nr:DUF1223 domain-containing protein [Sagittula salina]MBP0481781.1 DUF1223 domain-containing protein [Sagittula salina]
MRGILALGLAIWTGIAGAVQADDAPVVVELFTSQGCSSCPPADALLAELAERDDVIPLAFHVDYWDYIGWKDNFASPKFTKRQKGYARAGGWKMIYTPQIVVNGMEDVVGSRPAEVADLIAAHEDKPAHAKVTLTRRGDRVLIRAQGNGRMQACDVSVLHYAPAQEVTIDRGENAGKTILYTHIVRDWDVTARWDGTGTFEMEVPSPAGQPVVVLLQAPRYGPILAAARLE